MGRQRQGSSRRKPIAANENALRDALDATQQQTLPVLPANAPDASHTGSSSTARPTSHARAPRRTLGDATAAQTRITRTGITQSPRPTPGAAGALPDLDTVAAPVPGSMPPSWEAPLAASAVDDLFSAPGQVPFPADLSASRPSRSMPSRSGTRLPVPMAPASHDVMPSAASQSRALLIKGSGRARPSAFRIVPRRRGPRSFMSQFFAGMVAVMVLVSVLTLASPLGRGTVFAGGFQSYANAVPWVPTPTPTPKPSPTPVPYAPPPGANPGQQAIINDIVAIFGPYAQGAINVSRCESGFDPNARNPYPIGNSHAEGVFQILYPSTWDTTSYSGYSPYAYDANIRAAHEIFTRDGNSWREWACQP